MSEPLRIEVTLSPDAVEAITAEVTRRVLAELHDGQRDRGWLTVKDAATYVGLSEHALRHVLDRHEIPRSQHVPGGRILIPRDALDAYLRDEAHR